MSLYKCSICGYIYDEAKESNLFSELDDDYNCPMCGVPKNLFNRVEKIEEEKILKNAVAIDKDNVAIKRIIDRCIDCGLCKQTCIIKEGMDFDMNSELCLYCGQCIQSCPVKALVSRPNFNDVLKAKKAGKKIVAYTSPSVRASIGEIFNKYGSFEQEKMIGLLRMLDFDYVFDTTFAADLTIMEEASELVDRIKNNKKLPMFTSCCPAWVKYAEQFYPELIDNISTCKSPIGMMGPVVKKYFTKENNMNEDDIYTVAITPCTAKKYEIRKDEITGTDLVITVNELADIIKEKNIKYDDIPNSQFDSFFKEGSGAGVIFGNTGGVMEAALRTAYYLITNKDLSSEVVFNDVRGYDNVKEAEIKIGELELSVAVIHQMSSAKDILEDVKNNNSKYDFIEIMNCCGGCIGGGGQPLTILNKADDIKKQRIETLYKRDYDSNFKSSYQNPDIKKIYRDFLQHPLSDKSKELLHTKYEDKSYLKR